MYEYFLTRLFIVIFISISIGTAIFILISVQNQLITVSHPTVETYDQLYNDSSGTLQCPCSLSTMPYGTFLNVTFVLHQVCSSDLVSKAWINYVSSLEPNSLPGYLNMPWSRDFRHTGASYFQLLAGFCSLAETVIENNQRIFLGSQFINNFVISRSSFTEKSSILIKYFFEHTINNFRSIIRWTNITGTMNQFQTGVSIFFGAQIGGDGEILIGSSAVFRLATFNATSISSTNLCFCANDYYDCFIRSVLYGVTYNPFDYLQIFYDLNIGCIPFLGFINSTINWWYDSKALVNIQASYTAIINSQSAPVIKPLSLSVPSQFHDDMNTLLNAMFVERSIINEVNFNKFYKACAPISCSYVKSQRRSILLAIVLLVAVCSGINKILRIFIPFSGKIGFILIHTVRHRNSTLGRYDVLSYVFLCRINK